MKTRKLLWMCTCWKAHVLSLASKNLTMLLYFSSKLWNSYQCFMGIPVICQSARCSFLFSHHSLPQESLHSTLTRYEFRVSCFMSHFSFSSICFLLKCWLNSKWKVGYLVYRGYVVMHVNCQGCLVHLIDVSFQGCACGSWMVMDNMDR